MLLSDQPLPILFREKSAVSHSITWRNALSAKPVEIDGAVAFAISGQLQFFSVIIHMKRERSIFVKIYERDGQQYLTERYKRN